MKYSIYSIRDDLTGFLTPTFEVNDAVAMRNFSYAVERDDSLLSSHPQDYSFYHIGYFDSDTGCFESIQPPNLICRASSLVHKSSARSDE